MPSRCFCVHQSLDSDRYFFFPLSFNLCQGSVLIGILRNSLIGFWNLAPWSTSVLCSSFCHFPCVWTIMFFHYVQPVMNIILCFPYRRADYDYYQWEGLKHFLYRRNVFIAFYMDWHLHWLERAIYAQSKIFCVSGEWRLAIDKFRWSWKPRLYLIYTKP